VADTCDTSTRSHSQLHPKDVEEGRARWVHSDPLSMTLYGDRDHQLSAVIGSCNLGVRPKTLGLLYEYVQPDQRQMSHLSASSRRTFGSQTEGWWIHRQLTGTPGTSRAYETFTVPHSLCARWSLRRTSTNASIPGEGYQRRKEEVFLLLLRWVKRKTEGTGIVMEQC